MSHRSALVRRRIGVFLMVVALFPLGMGAAVLVDVDQTLGAGDGSFEGQAVTVSGAVLEIEGDHSFGSLTLTSGATVRQAGGTTLNVSGALVIDGVSSYEARGLNLDSPVEGAWAGEGVTIEAGSVMIGSGSILTADGFGYIGAPALGTPGAGPSAGADHQGGGHGGRGGVNTSLTDADRTPAYGSAWQPVTPGSGGGAHSTTVGGGAGGGAIHLITPTLLLEGEISADGLDGFYNSGGGAGGSIWLEVGDLSGSGALTVEGGNEGHWGYAGSGAGGRIAVHYTGSMTYAGPNAVALAGSAFPAVSVAEDGTVAFYDRSGAAPSVAVYSQFTFPADIPGSIADVALEGGTTRLLGGETLALTGTLSVADGATLRVEGADIESRVDGAWAGKGGRIEAETVSVAAGGMISADAQGYIGARDLGETGAGPAGGADHQGSGHGGRGGVTESLTDEDRGPAYGSAWEPTAPGSGGGAHSVDVAGGSGGGVIRLIADTLVVDGEISADGVNGYYNSGGGAGGSIWISVEDFSGSGSLTATGGNEGHWGYAGSGAGGRIAVHHTGMRTFPGTNADVSAGTGYPTVSVAEHGTAGFFDRSGALPKVAVSTHFTFPAGITEEVAALDLEAGTTRLLGGETLAVAGPLTVAAGATLQVETRDRKIKVGEAWRGAGGTIEADSLTVETGGLITADGLGYIGAKVPGVAAAGPAGGGDHQGGGHGGRGGVTESLTDADRTPAYDSSWEPDEPGSGGGVHNSSDAGGSGGGAIHVIVDTLTVDGEISADGVDGIYDSGGGAGGAIWIEVADFFGSGLLTATGGAEGHWGYAGSGAGGRIAVHHTGTRTFPGENADVSAGSGYPAVSIGEHGTAAFFDRSGTPPGVTVYTHFTVPSGLPETLAWFDLEGGTTRLLGGEALTVIETLTVGDGAVLQVETANRLETVEDAWMGAGGTITASTIVVEENGTITADGLGYAGALGISAIGAGPAGGAKNVGAGHGGSGGVPERLDESERPTAYGSYWNPTTPGSGGGAHNDSVAGGSGGGAIHLVCDNLVLNGEITADGTDGYYDSAGGAGGAVWIETTDFSGAGTITASGGAEGHWGYGASGAGGRIAVHYDGALGFSGIAASAPAGSGYPAISIGGDGSVAFFDRAKEGRHLTVFQTMELGAGAVHDFDSLALEADARLILGGGSRLRIDEDLNLSAGAELRLLGARNREKIEGRWSGLGGWVEATSMTLAEGSVITATGQGYRAIPTEAGQGPGGGPIGGGGAYGGAGGQGHVRTVAGTYGDETIPLDLGSSGGGNANPGHVPGNGGGAIFLRADTLTLNGAIEADGTGGRYSSGSGAGGSVLLDVGTLTGTGTISASGGDGIDVNWDPCGGGGGRIAIYYTNSIELPEENILVEGGDGYPSSDLGKAGTVYLSSEPRFTWARVPAGPQHGTVIVRPLTLGAVATDLEVAVSVEGEGIGASIDASIPVGEDLEIDTTTLPDGPMELVAVFTDRTGKVVGGARTPFGINNTDTWHYGEIAADETWAADATHIVDGTLDLLAGVSLSIEPGAVVKFTSGSGIELADGSTLLAEGTESNPIIFTSIADDTVSGDTNRDGDGTEPRPGDWDRFEVYGEAVLTLNEYTVLYYSRAVHSGALAASTIWTADVVHEIESTVTVPDGTTLAIEPGTIVRLDSLQSLIVEAGGRLLAEGTRGAPILFTSSLDPSGGGGVPSGADAPSAGDWRSLVVRGEASLEYAQLRYGGGTGGSWENTAMLKTEGGSADLIAESCWVAESIYDGIGLWEGSATVNNTVVSSCDRGILVRGGNAEITHCTIYGNRVGVHPHGGSSTWVNNIIAASHERGMWNSGGIARFAYNNVWSASGVNYYAYDDPTGTEGNLSVDPAFRALGSGSFQLDYGSPMIDAADGAMSSAGDFSGAPRYDDPRSENTGTETAGGGYADMGAFEFVEGAASDLDLIVTSVEGPSVVIAGDEVVVEWTVRNAGTVPLVGPWEDAIGLIDDLGERLDAGRVEVASGRTLAPGNEMEMRATVRVPGGTIGNYRWVVDVNEGRIAFEGVNSANNRTLARGETYLDLVELTVGAPVSDAYPEDGTSWFKLVPPAGADVLVNVDSGVTTGASHLDIGVGDAPDAGLGDIRSVEWNSPDVSALIASATSQVHYLRVSGSDLLTDAELTIGAAILDASLTSVRPGRIHHAGYTTLEVRGGGFDELTQFHIVDAAGSAFAAVNVSVEDGSRAYVTFAGDGMALGVYDLQMGFAAAAQVLEDAVEIVAGSPGQLQVEVTLPEAMRSFSTDSIFVSFENVGDADVALPLFLLRAEGNLNPWDGTRDLVPVMPGAVGNEGVLRPGESGTFEVVLDSGSGAGMIDVGLRVSGLGDPTVSMQWDAIGDELRPFFVPEAAWDPIFANFRALVGESFGEFSAALASEAGYLGGVGVNGMSPEDLVGFLMLQSGLATISARHMDGDLGYGRFGWWEYTLLQDPVDGHVFLNSAGTFRSFQRVESSYSASSASSIPSRPGLTMIIPEPKVEYRGMPGDRGTLTPVAGGGFELVEANGAKITYDPAGRWTRMETASGEFLEAEYMGGEISKVTTWSGEGFDFTVNGRGHVTRVDEPGGTSVVFGYDPSGDHVSSITDHRGTIRYTNITGRGAAVEHALETITMPGGGVLTLEYDDEGAMVGLDGPKNFDQLDIVRFGHGGSINFPGAGMIYRSFPDHRGNIARLEGEDGGVFEFAYNESQQPTRVKGPEGLQESFQYSENGSLTVRTDGLGNSQRYRYDETNRLLTAMTDARGNRVHFEYDEAGNLTSLRYPDGATVQASYDAEGRCATTTNARGEEIAYEWDTNGALGRVDFEGGSYVEYGRNGRGILDEVVTAEGAIEFTYDSADQMTRVDYPDGKWIAYDYNVDGQRTRLRTHAGLDLNYEYGTLGQLLRIREATEGVLVDFEYDAQMRLSAQEYPDGARTEMARFSSGKLSSLVHRDAAGAVIESYACTYDGLGRLSTLVTADAEWTYSYDVCDRLVTADHSSGISYAYAYDAAGNRTEVVRGGQTLPYRMNRLDQYTEAEGTTFTYDADGNLVKAASSAGDILYTYGPMGQLIRRESGTDVTEYEYNALGHRTAVVHNGERTEFLVDPAAGGIVLGEFAGNGFLRAHFVGAMGPMARIAADGTCHYYAHDPMGNVAILLSGAGTVENEYAYTPFGTLTAESESVPNRFKFGGGYGLMQDEDSLVFAQTRYYDPQTGRFLSRDPLPLIGQNLYAYAGNNPIGYTDVDGRNSVPAELLGWLIWGVQCGQEMEMGEFEKYWEKWKENPGLESAQYGLRSMAYVFKLAEDFFDYPARAAYSALQSRLYNYTGNFMLGRQWGELAKHQASAGNFISKTGKVLGVVGVGFSAYNFYSTYDKYTRNEATEMDMWHDGGVLVGGVMGLYCPPLGAAFAAWDWATYHVSLKLFEVFPDLGQDWWGEIDRVGSHDPNDIAGPTGSGEEGWILPTVMNYRIRFENDAEEATAPAQVVWVTLPLDEDLDWSTFRVGEFGFGGLTVSAPDGLSEWSGRVDARGLLGLDVDLYCEIDPDNGVVTWTFVSIDPDTGGLPRDPYAGFLPPNETPPEGDGFVTFSVEPKEGVELDTIVLAQAEIVFDTNEPIMTNVHRNTIDPVLPSCSVVALPSREGSSFLVRWAGSDSGAGLATFDVYVSVDGGAFTLWQDETSETSAVYVGEVGHVYAFEVVGKDAAGNTELATASSEGATTVIGLGMGYTLWLSEHFEAEELGDALLEPLIWGDGADPDRDGYLNLWEYFMGTDPRVKDPRGLIEVEATEGTLTLRYRHSLRAPVVEGTPETSGDLQTWSEAGVTDAQAQSGAESEERTATVPIDEDPVFIRLKLDK